VSLAELLGVSIAVVAVAMTALWLLSLAMKNASIVDIVWGLGFVLLAAVYFAAADGFAGRKLLVLALVAVWGLRLSGYILWRNWGKGEDYRYTGWRDRPATGSWWTSLFRCSCCRGC
jgi:steroid 5-alpha reductase family enzyme